MERLSVWTKTPTGWSKVQTNDFVGTKDELTYFRVTKDGIKDFFVTPNAYFEYAGIVDVSDELEEAINLWNERMVVLSNVKEH